jgi:methionyl-tRNA synthetase
MDKTKKYCITSALPYANGALHLGHLSGAYLPADIYVRYLRGLGLDVVYICGSDEHGAAITMRAKKEGTTPQEIIDKYHFLNKETFDRLGISFDYYHRTSAKLHHETSQAFFKKLYEKGDQFEARTTEQYYDEDNDQFLADRYITGECPKCGNPEAYGDQCERCGSSLSPTELKNPKSVLSGKTPILKPTKHWYFRLDKHANWLREWIKNGVLDGRQHHDPNVWKKHVTGQCLSWLDDGEGLLPRAITRDLDWGIPVPLDEAKGKVLYVWFDAPIGYISSTKQWALENGKNWEEYWKDKKKIYSTKLQRVLGKNQFGKCYVDKFGRKFRIGYGSKIESNDVELIHFIGKDNIVFHCIVFPAMLKAHGDFALPVNVPANQFLNFEGRKFSKSKNWGIEQHEYLEEFAEFPNKEDALRWALIRNMPENRDSDFKWDEFVDFYDKDLADNLGNFINRVIVLTNNYFDGKVPKPDSFFLSEDSRIVDLNDTLYQVIRSVTAPDALDIKGSEMLEVQLSYCEAIEAFKFRMAAENLLEISSYGNQYLQNQAPWKVWKELPNDESVKRCIFISLQIVYVLAVLCSPFLPFTSKRIRKLLGLDEVQNGEIEELIDKLKKRKALLLPNHQIGQPEVLFPKINDRKDDSRLKIIERQKAKLEEVLAAEKANERPALKDEIQYDDFAKMDIRTATILAAERIPKADKLLKLTVDIGLEQRTVVSGIAEHFTPEEVVGKKVLLLTNLAPRKLRGVESQGMILMAEDAEGKLGFVSPGEGWENGFVVK